MKFEFSAGGIIYRHKGQEFEFALILDSYDKWTFPKGHIEKHEKPEVAAQREVGEEIGIENLKLIKLLEKIDYWFKSPPAGGGQTIHKYVYFYLMEAPVEAELKPQISEIKDAQWFSPKESLNHLGYKKDSERVLRRAFEELKIVVY